MKKLILLLILLIIFSGCNLIKSTQKPESDIIGSEGLIMTLPNIPNEMFIGQGLQIPITLENAGASNVENGVLIIGLYDPDIVKFTSKPKIEGINLKGKTEFIPGEQTTEVFTISSINLPNIKEKQEAFEAVACYQYKTRASPVVCINSQLTFGTSAVQSGCDFIDAKISPSQGAPVVITKVQTWYYADRPEIEFRIFVSNEARGVVLERNAYSKRCLTPQPLEPKDLNVVRIDASLGGIPIQCYSLKDEPTNTFIISNEGFSIRCRSQIDPRTPAYTTLLSLDLSYGYVQLQPFTITLKNPAFIG